MRLDDVCIRVDSSEFLSANRRYEAQASDGNLSFIDIIVDARSPHDAGCLLLEAMEQLPFGRHITGSFTDLTMVN